MDVLEKARWEIGIFERPSKETSLKMMDEITNLRQAISEAEQREKDAKRIAINAEKYGYGHGIEEAENREKAARVKALEDAAKVAENWKTMPSNPQRHLGHRDAADAISAAIRALKDEVR